MHFLSKSTFDLTSLAIPLAAVLVFAGILLAVLSVVRRRMKVQEHAPLDFSLTDLRNLHRQGKLTDDEFEKAKALMVNKVHTTLAKEVKPSMVAEPMNTDISLVRVSRSPRNNGAASATRIG